MGVIMKKLLIITVLFLAMPYSKTSEPRPTRKLRSFDLEYRELQRINTINNSDKRKKMLIDFLYNGLSSYGNLLSVINLTEDLNHKQRDAQTIKGLIKIIAKNSGVTADDIRYEDTLHIDPLMDKDALEIVKKWLVQ